MPEGPIVFLNGQMVPAARAHLNIYDRGIVLGATVTEMARTFGRKPFRLERHLRRLAGSLQCVGFDIGMSMDQLGETAQEVVEHNARLLGAGGELGLVIFVTAGEHPMYAGSPDMTIRPGPTLCVHTFPLLFHLWAQKMRCGADLVTTSIRHVPPQCIPSGMKHRSRMHYCLAEQEARQIAPEAIPLLLDVEGNVAETSTANFLIVERETIVSPRLTNILPGISREMIVELAAGLGIPFVERDFGISDVERADEALLASTPYCLMPAVRVNQRPIGDGRPGPVFRRLIDAWSEAVGLDVYGQIVGATGPTGQPGDDSGD